MKQPKLQIDQSSYQECGKVFQLACNVYKIVCSICEDYTNFESFISHYQQHLNSSCETSRSRKSSEYIQTRLRSKRLKINNEQNQNKKQSRENGYSVKDDHSVEDEDEDYDDFMWDNITDSDVNSNGSSDDEPLIDIQALLLKKSEVGSETEQESFYNENNIDQYETAISPIPEINASLCTKNSDKGRIGNNFQKCTTGSESSDDSYTWDNENESIEKYLEKTTLIESSDDDDSYSWDNDNESIGKKSKKIKKVIESSDGDDSYSWDNESIGKKSKKAKKVIESSDDDDSYSWDNDNESNRKKSKKIKKVIEISDGDDDDSYGWDVDSCESDYPDVNAARRKRKHKELFDKCNVQLDESGTVLCQYCPNRFSSKVGLMSHLRTHQISFSKEKKEKVEFKCKECGKIFRGERGLRTHMYKHTGIFCEICNKQFSAVGNMMRHKLMHAGIKSHRCTQCTECFYTINELDTHSAKHTGVRKVICELCGKPCRDRGVLAQHMLRHTGERPVKCNHCNKSFYSNHDLKEHVVIHSEARPFSCEICGATFQRKKSLRVHKKIHSNEPCTEECTVCGKKFAKPSGLLSHMRVHDTVYGLSYPVGGWRGDKQGG